MLARRLTIVNESTEWRLAIQRSDHAGHPTYARSNYTTVGLHGCRRKPLQKLVKHCHTRSRVRTICLVPDRTRPGGAQHADEPLTLGHFSVTVRDDLVKRKWDLSVSAAGLVQVLDYRQIV
jgi:hypothetical protein